MGEVTDRTVVVAVEAREAVGPREKLALRVAEVPLAHDHALSVTGDAEQFRQRVFRRRQPVARPRWNNGPHEAKARRPAPRHEAGARGRTHGARAKIREIHAGRGEAVEIGGGDDLAAIEPDIGEAEIVGDDDQDVGFGRLGPQDRGEQKPTEKRKAEE